MSLNRSKDRKRISLFETNNREEKPVSKTFTLNIDYPMVIAVEDELQSFAKKQDVNFSLTLTRSTVNIQINIVNPAEFASADKSFKAISSVLNAHRLTTRDREECIVKYEQFLVDNHLSEFIRSHSRR